MKLALAATALLVAVGVAACGGPPAAEPAPSGPLAGVIAFGHSGLTGEGTGQPLEPVLENSWATGTSPDVNSVFTRLVAVRPENAGHAANTAVGGASSDTLVRQAKLALESVPLPQLVIISTIDGDIRCDGTDPDHIPEFGQAVADALDVISTASPDSTILIVGQAGRPSVSFVQELVAQHPEAKRNLSGDGPCAFFDNDGNLILETFDFLTEIIDDYEAEEARVCALVPHCFTDGGVRAAYVDTLENFSSDWAHLNVKGQAAEAELIWPAVVSALGL